MSVRRAGCICPTGALRPSVVSGVLDLWADHRADATLGEEGFVVLAVKAAVGHHVAEFVGKIHGLMRSTLSRIFSPSLSFSFIKLATISPPQLARNSSLLNSTWLPALPRTTHIDVRFVGTEDFVRIVDLASADDPLVLVRTCGSSSSFSSIRASNTRPARCCNVFSCRAEQVAVPAGVIAMRSRFFILRSTFLRIFSALCDGCASSRCTAGSSAG